MTLLEKLEILQNQYNQMLEYHAICNNIGSTISYSSIDFEREGELLKKINQTKDQINGKK